MNERVKIIDPKVTRRRKLWQMLCVIVLGLCAMGYVRRDYVRKVIASRLGQPAAQPAAVVAQKAAPPAPVKVEEPAKEEPAPEMTAEQAQALQEAMRNAQESLGAMKMASSDIPADASWPRQVSLQGVPPIDVVSEDEAASKFVYRSPHYEFRSDTRLGADVVREFARVFEVTHMAVCKLPLDLRPTPENLRPRFTARLFKSEKEYFEAGGMEGSSGCYKRGEKCILVPLDSLGVKVLGGRTTMDRGGSANATLIHEITHQMMNHWLPRLPAWYTEGSAEYMVVGDYLHGRFNFSQIENLLKQYLKRRGSRDGFFAMLRPGELMALDSRTWSETLARNHELTRQNYVSALLLTFFFHHMDGEGGLPGIIPYLRAIENGETERHACRDHLVRGRSIETLESDVKNAFRRLGFTITFESRGGEVWSGADKTARLRGIE